jgi:hypothetical protein
MNAEHQEVVDELTTLIAQRIEGDQEISKEDCIEMMEEVIAFCESSANAMRAELAES